MRVSSLSFLAAPLFAAALIAGCASAPEGPRQAEIRQEVQLAATVTAVDSSTRHLTLRRSDGVLVDVVAGPEVRNFDRIAVGDTIRAQYVETLSARILDDDEADTQSEVAVAAARSPLGEDPAGGIVGGLAVTVRVESVDRDKHIVVLTDPGGVLRVVQAQREKGKEFVAGLQPGDRVELVYGEGLILGVE